MNASDLYSQKWPFVPLGDVCSRICNGLSIKQSSDTGGLPVSRIETISQGVIDPSKIGYAGVQNGERDEWLLEKGDILFSHINSLSHLGKCALYCGCPEKLIHGMNLLVLRADRNRITPDFLLRLLRTPSFRIQSLRFVNQSVNQVSLSVTNLRSLEIPLPPLLEQRRIAAILDKAEAIRRKRQEALALTDEFLRSAFLEMFGDPVTNPKGWEVAGLADLVGGPVRNGLSPSNRGSYPGQVLTLSAITKGIFQAKKHKEALFDTELPKDKRVDSRDFLICRGNGNIDLVGTGVFPTKSLPDVLFPDTMIGFRINLDNVTRSYLEILWKSRLIRRQIEKGARTTNGTYKINQNILNSISFPLPPIKIQQQFDNIAIHVVRVAKNMSDEIDTILFDSLTQRAFRGEL